MTSLRSPSPKAPGAERARDFGHGFLCASLGATAAAAAATFRTPALLLQSILLRTGPRMPGSLPLSGGTTGLQPPQTERAPRAVSQQDGTAVSTGAFLLWGVGWTLATSLRRGSPALGGAQGFPAEPPK